MKKVNIKVTQVGSSAGRDKRVKATLSALGLGRIGKVREYPVNPALLGMLKKISHLISIEKI